MSIRAKDNLLMTISINLSVLSFHSSVCIGVNLYDECFLSPVHAFPQSTRARFIPFSNNLTNEQLPLP